jgi:hypothetical protein
MICSDAEYIIDACDPLDDEAYGSRPDRNAKYNLYGFKIIRPADDDKPGYGYRYDEELHHLDPQIEAQHAQRKVGGHEMQVLQRLRKSQSMDKAEAEGDNYFATAKQGSDRMNGGYQDRKGYGDFDPPDGKLHDTQYTDEQRDRMTNGECGDDPEQSADHQTRG